MDIPANDDQRNVEVGSVIKHASMTARIHETLYTLESRIIQEASGRQRPEYRVRFQARESGAIASGATAKAACTAKNGCRNWPRKSLGSN